MEIKVEARRSTNFLTKEIEYLLELIEKKKNVIECKKTDRTTSEEKMRCWVEIEAEFNSAFDSYRSFKTLKTKYENLKKEAKKNYAIDKQETYKTGGGIKPPSKVTPVDENIFKIVQEEQMVGLESIYDDDKLETSMDLLDKTDFILERSTSMDKTDILQNITNAAQNKNDVIIIEDSNERYIIDNTPQENSKWKNYTPKMLKNQKHQALKTGDKRKSNDALWAEVAEKKVLKIQLEMKVTEEESKLKKTKLELEIAELKQKIKKNDIELEMLEIQKKKEENYITKKYPKEF